MKLALPVRVNSQPVEKLEGRNGVVLELGLWVWKCRWKVENGSAEIDGKELNLLPGKHGNVEPFRKRQRRVSVRPSPKIV